VLVFSFKNYSLVAGSSEIWRFWLVGDTSSFGVAIFGEGTSNKGNHFLNRMSKIGPK